jgi:AcrR family transcriptional regulator
MGLREEKKERVREQIIRVCEELFRNRGFDETTVADIIQHVVISRQTFFNYFPSKGAVLTELGLRWIEAQAESPRQGALRAAEAPTNVLAATREATRLQLRAIQSDREFARLIFTRSGLFFGHGAELGTGSAEPAARRTRGMFEAAAEVMKLAQRTGELRSDFDPLQVAEIYVSVMVTTARFWLTGYSGEDVDLEERGMRAVDILFAGLASGSKNFPAP